MCGPDHNGPHSDAQFSGTMPAGLAPYTFSQATSISPLPTSLWSWATEQLFRRAATSLSLICALQTGPHLSSKASNDDKQTGCRFSHFVADIVSLEQCGLKMLHQACLVGQGLPAEQAPLAVQYHPYYGFGDRIYPGHGRLLQEQNDGQGRGRHIYSNC